MNYYGVRFAKDCHPDDLWKTYFTSSAYVAEYRIEHGEPDIIEIRQRFTGDERRQRSLLWETRVLKKIGAVDRPDFLNKHGNGAYDHSNTEIEKKRGESISKSKNTDEFRQNNSGMNWWNTDKTLYDFVHKDGRTETCTRIELCRKYNLRDDKITRIINGSESSRKSHGGWMLDGTTYKKRGGSISYNFDHTIYHFVNHDGIVETCTRHHLYTIYNLSSHKIMLVIQGKRIHHKGWRLLR